MRTLRNALLAFECVSTRNDRLYGQSGVATSLTIGRLIGWTKGGINTKLHAVTDADCRPMRFVMIAGQVSDYTGAAALLGSLPKDLEREPRRGNRSACTKATRPRDPAS